MIREAEYAESKADFKHKFAMVQKEINETLYYLDLLKQTDFLTNEHFNNIYEDGIEIIKLVTAIIKSSKASHQ